MSKLFVDHILNFDNIAIVINNSVQTEDERHELWKVVDDIVYHEVMHFLLEALDEVHHEEFADIIHTKPYDPHIIKYASKKTGRKMKAELKKHLRDLETQILKSLFDNTSK